MRCEVNPDNQSLTLPLNSLYTETALMSAEIQALERLMEVERLPAVVGPKCVECRNYKCKTCTYLASDQSFEELANDELYLNQMTLKEEGKLADGSPRYRIYVDFLENPKIRLSDAFDIVETNRHAILHSSINLIEKMKKWKLLDDFQDRLEKTISQGALAWCDKRLGGEAAKLYNVHEGLEKNYNRLNIMRSSEKSTKLRIVSDTTTLGIRKLSVNQTMAPSSKLLCNLATVNRKFCFHQYAFSTDISAAFFSLRTTKRWNSVRRLVYFQRKDLEFVKKNNPEKYRHLLFDLIYTATSMGDSLSPAALELCLRRIIAKHLQEIGEDAAAECLANSRLVDDCKNSYRRAEERDHVAKKIIEGLEKYSFKIKELFFEGCKGDLMQKPILTNLTQAEQTEVEEGAGISKGFGYYWTYQTDELRHCFSLFPLKKLRGAQTGPPLEEWDLEKIPMTKTTLSRLNGQLFDITLRWSGVLNVAAKVLFSQMCEAAGPDPAAWHKELSQTHPELREQFLTWCREIIFAKQNLKPYLRYALGATEEIVRIVVVVDGGQRFHAVWLALVVKEKSGNLTTRFIQAKSRTGGQTVPQNEALARALGVQLVVQWVFEIHYLQEGHLEIVVVGDSFQNTHYWSPTHHFKNPLFQRLISESRRAMQAAIEKNEKIEFHHVWLPSEFLSADFISKSFLNVNGEVGHLTQIINSDHFRNGYPIYQTEELKKDTFLVVADGVFEYTPLKMPAKAKPGEPREPAESGFNSRLDTVDYETHLRLLELEDCQQWVELDLPTEFNLEHDNLEYLPKEDLKSQDEGNSNAETQGYDPDEPVNGASEPEMASSEDDDDFSEYLPRRTKRDLTTKIGLGSVAGSAEQPDRKLLEPDESENCERIFNDNEKESYDSLVNNCSKFETALQAVANVLSFIARLRKQDIQSTSLKGRAFIILVKESQTFYPVKIEDSQRIEAGGITFSNFRYSWLDIEASEQIINAPIIASEDRFCFLVIKASHVTTIAGFKTCRTGRSTFLQSRIAEYPIIPSNPRSILKAVRKSCFSCKKKNPVRFLTPLGRSRWIRLLQSKPQPKIFEHLSMDILGPWRVESGKRKTETRLTTIYDKVWVLGIYDVIFRVVDFYELQSYSFEEVNNAMERHLTTHGSFCLSLVVDSGSQLSEELLAPVLQKAAMRMKKPLPAIIQLGVGQQARSQIESRVEECKNLWKEIFKNHKDSPIPRSEFLLTLAEVKTILHSRPYADILNGDSSIMCPLNLIRPAGNFDCIANLNRYSRKGQYAGKPFAELLTTKAIEALRESIIAENQYNQRFFGARVWGARGRVSPEEGDICLFTPNETTFKLAQITKIQSQSNIQIRTLLIRTKDGGGQAGLRTVHSNQLSLLYRENEEEDFKNGLCGMPELQPHVSKANKADKTKSLESDRALFLQIFKKRVGIQANVHDTTNEEDEDVDDGITTIIDDSKGRRTKTYADIVKASSNHNKHKDEEKLEEELPDQTQERIQTGQHEGDASRQDTTAELTEVGKQAGTCNDSTHLQALHGQKAPEKTKVTVESRRQPSRRTKTAFLEKWNNLKRKL